MCTSILVGSEVTADGSYIITRSADHASRSPQHFIIHPAVSGQKRIHSTAACGGVNHFSWTMPENTLRYTSFPNWKTHLHGGEGFNEAGFGMTATESIFAKPEVLAVDPYTVETGITEDDIPDVILPQCRTAIEGVKLLGKIVEEAGAGEGFGVAFVDKDGVWWFETGSGHQWIAQKLPQDKYYTTGNQGRLQDYDPDSPDMMASATLVSFAIEHGFYNPETDGAFNFSKVYTRNDERDRIYNDPRVWQIQKRFNPSLIQDPHDGRNFPVYLKPEAKISLSDIRSIMRDHYEGTEHDPYTNGLNGKEHWRPISVFRTYETHIMHVRPWLPKEIGEVVYLALGMADLSVFVHVGEVRVRNAPLHILDIHLIRVAGQARLLYVEHAQKRRTALADLRKDARLVVQRPVHRFQAELYAVRAARRPDLSKTRADPLVIERRGIAL